MSATSINQFDDDLLSGWGTFFVSVIVVTFPIDSCDDDYYLDKLIFIYINI